MPFWHEKDDPHRVVEVRQYTERPQTVWPQVCDFLGLSQVADIAFEQHNSRSRSAMDPALRQQLTDDYQPYDEQLTTWWGRVPSWRQ